MRCCQLRLPASDTAGGIPGALLACSRKWFGCLRKRQSRCGKRDRPNRHANAPSRLGSPRTGAAARQHSRLRRVLRALLRCAGIPSVRRALGRHRWSRRCHRKRGRMDPTARTRRARHSSRHVQESMGGPPAPVHRGAHRAGGVRPRRDVLQRIPHSTECSDWRCK